MRDTETLLKWIRKSPRPALLLVTSRTGTKHEVQLNGARMPRVIETLRAVNAHVIEALNGEKQVLRAFDLDDLDGDLEMPDEPEVPPHAASTFVPPLPPINDATLDAETRRFMVFAHYIATAYSHAQQVSFGQLAEMVSGMQQRSELTEQQRDQMYVMRIKQLEAQIRALNHTPVEGGGGVDFGQMMMAQFLGGMQSAGAGGAVPNGKTDEVD